MIQKVLLFFTLVNFIIFFYSTIMTIKMRYNQIGSCNKTTKNTNHVYKLLLEAKGNIIKIENNNYRYTDDILKIGKSYFLMESNLYKIIEIKKDNNHINIYIENAELNLVKGIYLLYFI